MATPVRYLYFALFLASITQTISHGADVFFDQFKGNIDEDAICEQLANAYGLECRDSIPESAYNSLSRAIAKADHEEAWSIIFGQFEKVEPALNLDIVLCRNVKEELSTMEPGEIHSYIHELVSKYDASIDMIHTRSERLLRSRAIKSSKTTYCNLATILRPFGKVSVSGFRAKAKKISEYLPTSDISFASLIAQAKDYLTPPDNTARVNAIIDAEREASKKAATARKTRMDLISNLESSCLMDRNEADCLKMYKSYDAYILETLGTHALRAIRSFDASPSNQDSLRSVLYTLSRTVNYWREFELFRTLERLADGGLVALRVSPAVIILVLTIIFLYRAEAKLFASMALGQLGCGILPATAMLRKGSVYLTERAGSLSIIASAVITTLAYHSGFSYEAVLTLVYLSLVIYYNIFQASSSPYTSALSLGPMAAYVVARELDFSRLAFPMASAGKWYDIPMPSLALSAIPDISGIVAIVFCLAIFITAAYCDTLGIAVYVDTMNKRARHKPDETYVPTNPTPTDYVLNSLNVNALIVLGCVAIPGIASSQTWVVASAAFTGSVLVASCIYYTMFHHEYVREGNTTGSSKDRVEGSMNIIFGAAPQNVILPRFQKLVVGMISAITFSLGARYGFITASIAASVVGITCYNKPGQLSSAISWTTGIVILLSGSPLHAAVGIAYLIFKVGRNINISTRSMIAGETARELTAT